MMSSGKEIQPFLVFNSKIDVKTCGMWVIIEPEKKILYIEMKAGKGPGEDEIIQQLKGAQCFIAYCREVGRLFWKKEGFLKEYKSRFVSIREISISKRPTRIRPKLRHDLPEQMLKISSPKYLQLQELIA